MVRHHYRFPVERLRQLVLQPVAAGLVPGHGVAYQQAAIALPIVSDLSVIGPFQLQLIALPVRLRPVEPHVRPERAAQEAHAVDGDGIVFQQVDVRAGRGLPHLLDGPEKAPPEELMVAGDHDHRLVLAVFLCPGHGLDAFVNVAGQHHHIGSGHGYRRWHKWLELVVQVGVDQEAHVMSFQVGFFNIALTT